MTELISQIIFASQTPGNAPNVGAALDTWELNAADGSIIYNGVVDTTSTSVIAIYYNNHTVYKVQSTGNSFGSPGWWAWNGGTTKWSAGVSNPITESSEGSSIISPGQIIFSSQTPGAPAAAGSALDLFSIASNRQINRNAVNDTTTSNVQQLYYHNHRTYYQNSISGWWYWNGSAWSATTNPVTGLSTIAIDTIENQQANVALTISGELSGYSTIPNLQWQANSAGWSAAFSANSTTLFSTSVTGLPAANTNTISVRDAATTSIISTSNVFSVIGAVTLNSIAFTPLNSTFAPGSAPITVGTLAVSTTPINSFPGTTGTVSISGLQGTYFQIESDEATVQTAGSTLYSQNYNVTFTATLPLATNSPLSTSVVITSSGPPALEVGGPLTLVSATANSITISYGTYPSSTTYPNAKLDVEQGTSSSGPFTVVGTGIDLTGSCTITGLTALTAYYFGLAIVYNNNTNPYVTGGPFSTTSVQISVNKLTFKSATAWSIIFDYDASTLPDGSTLVIQSNTTSISGPYVSFDTNVSPIGYYLADNLAPSTNYYFEVAVVSGGTTYPYVTGGPFTTTTPAPFPGPITNPLVTANTYLGPDSKYQTWASMTITWSPPDTIHTYTYSVGFGGTSYCGPFYNNSQYAGYDIVTSASYTTKLWDSHIVCFSITAINSDNAPGPTIIAGPYVSAGAPTTLAPGPIENIRQGTTTNTSMTILWDTPSPDISSNSGSGYLTFISLSPKIGMILWAPETGSYRDTTTTYTDLIPATDYYYEIDLVNDTPTVSYWGTPAIAGPFKTSGTAYTPAAVAAAWVQYTTPTTQLIAWTNPADDQEARYYTFNVGYSTSSSGPFIITEVGYYSTNQAFYNLQPATNYYYQISATTSRVTGPATVFGPFATPSNNVPGEVLGINAVAQSTNQLIVSWQQLATPVNYNIYYSTSETGTYTLVKTVQNIGSTTITV